MLPRPAISTLAIVLLLSGMPGLLAAQRGRVAAEATGGRVGPAGLAAPLGVVDLVEPAVAAGAAHRLLAVLDRATADRTGRPPFALAQLINGHDGSGFRGKPEALTAEQHLV